jgi:hypothetical protein
MTRTHDEIRAERPRLAIVPLIEDGPQAAPGSTLPAETPSAGIRGGVEGWKIAHGDSGAIHKCPTRCGHEEA